jgi:hypothetical protein
MSLTDRKPIADINEQLWKNLRDKGYQIGDIYVQTGAAKSGGLLHVVINGVAMPLADAAALDQGIVTFDEISRHRNQSN